MHAIPTGTGCPEHAIESTWGSHAIGFVDECQDKICNYNRNLGAILKSSKIGAKLVFANLVGLSGLAAMPAHATLISNTLTSAVSTSADGSPAVAVGPTTDSAYVSNYGYSSGSNSSSNASAWGNSYGTYRASADGSGVFNGTGQFQRGVQLTNNNGYATDYSLTFFIYYGSINASNNGVTGSGYGSFDLSIKQNNSTTLFASGAKVNSDGTYTQTGTALNNATFFANANGAFYNWDGTYVTLNLGTLADGASTTINFDLVSTAFGNFATVDTSSGGLGGYGGYGGYGGCGVGDAVLTFAIIDGYGGGCTVTGSVYSSLGDPADFAENQFVMAPFTVAEQRNTGQVPIPGTLPLLALGLAGLAFSTRRYRQH